MPASPSSPPATAPAAMPRGLTLTLAVACGVAVANLYYAQPLLERLARDFRVGSGAAGLIVTLTQAGYAAGLLFVVPLGDALDRRRLTVGVLLVAMIALAGTALAPGYPAFAAGSLAVGLASVAAQVLVPFAASLAPPASRGAVLGTVMSGLLLGILLARTLSGAVAAALGWRAVYAVAALLMLALAVVLRRALPPDPRGGRLEYGRLMRSVLDLARAEPVLRRRAAYGALVFAAFSAFWTNLAFVLAGPPYRYGEATIGLFGLVGAAGALGANLAGRLADRGQARALTGAAVALIALSFLALLAGARSLAAMIAGVLALDLGVQGAHITNQSVVYALSPGARGRVTTVYMTSYFLGGAAGSAGSAALYGRLGWPGVCAFGFACATLALIGWALERPGPRAA